MMHNTLRTKISVRSFSTSLTALRGAKDRRIPVQLLRDFEGVGYKGEVVNVLSGFMRNKLHRNGGAAYVLKNKPLRIPEVLREDILARQAAEKAAQQEEFEQLQERQLEEESRLRTRRSVTEESMRSALESLGLTNDLFKISNTKATSTNESTPKDTSSPEPSLYQVESAIRSLPPVIVFQKSAISSGFLASHDHITLAGLAQHLGELTGTEIPSSILSFPISSSSESASAIDFVGDSSVVISFSTSGNTYSRTVRVVPSNNIPDFMSLKRPDSVPFPGTSPAQKAEQKIGHDTAASKTLAKEAAKAAAPSSPKTEKPKEFEWENDFLDEMTKR